VLLVRQHACCFAFVLSIGSAQENAAVPAAIASRQMNADVRPAACRPANLASTGVAAAAATASSVRLPQLAAYISGTLVSQMSAKLIGTGNTLKSGMPPLSIRR